MEDIVDTLRMMTGKTERDLCNKGYSISREDLNLRLSFPHKKKTDQGNVDQDSSSNYNNNYYKIFPLQEN